MRQHQNVEESDYDAVMETLGQRVTRIREEKLRISQQELAERVTRGGFKIGQSGIGNIESGRTKKPDCIIELAAALGVSVSWLRTGKGENTVAPAPVPPPSRNVDAISPTYPQPDSTDVNFPNLDHRKNIPLRTQMPLTLPVKGTVSGSDGGVKMGEAAIDFARRHPALEGRDDVFGLYVEDVSMQNAFNVGDLVLVEGKHPREGDHAVIEYRDTPHGEVKITLKKMKAMTTAIIRIEQYNPPKVIVLKRNQVIRMRRVLTMMDLFGV